MFPSHDPVRIDRGGVILVDGIRKYREHSIIPLLLTLRQDPTTRKYPMYISKFNALYTNKAYIDLREFVVDMYINKFNALSNKANVDLNEFVLKEDADEKNIIRRPGALNETKYYRFNEEKFFGAVDDPTWGNPDDPSGDVEYM